MIKMLRTKQFQDEQHNTTQERGTPQYKVRVNLHLPPNFSLQVEMKLTILSAGADNFGKFLL